MFFSKSKGDGAVVNRDADMASSVGNDEAELAAMGYKSEFKREFTNLGTISFAFSIMGVCSSVSTTFDTPMLLGGPASVVWCWALGATGCFFIGASIAELVSAYPTSGGLYSASCYLVPAKYRGPVGYVTGWMNLLGQIAGVASTEFGLSRMIWAAVNVYYDGAYVVTNGKLVGLFIGLLIVHGLLNSLATKYLASITQSFVFINLGAAFAIIIALLITTDNKNSASYTFTEVINESGWNSNGFAFLLGLLSVQWTMTDYDAAAHISEEVRRASIAAPVAIFVAVVGTGIIGWLYNVILVLCSPPIDQLPGVSGMSVPTIIAFNVGKGGFYALWIFVCFTAFAVVQTAMQANARTFFAFSRDGGLPDRGLFAKLAPNKVPLWGVWIVVAISIVLGLLQFASAVAVNAVFSLCAVALDTSYMIPVACKLIYRDHPEVNYKPGPFNLGRTGGAICNIIAITWTAFEVCILIMPTIYPVTAENMNYSSIITVGVMLLAGLWYWVSARKYYDGPRSNLDKVDSSATSMDAVTPPLSDGSSEKKEGELEDVSLDRKH